MTLRIKLLLAALPLALALALVGAVSIVGIDALAATSNRILTDNYRSVLAAQRMKESIERMDGAALFRVLGAAEKAETLEQVHRAAFEVELREQEQNITEVGEDAITGRLRAAWLDYVAHYTTFTRAPSAEAYFSTLEPRFLIVKSTADELLSLNQDAMVRKSDDARRDAENTGAIVTWSSIAALVLGLGASSWLTSRLLRPLDNLSLVARRLGEGELAVRASVMGRDEIAELATEFNEMAKRLEAFRKSSLGELLQAQVASQATIDSLPDPVVVFETSGRTLISNESADSDLRLDSTADNPLAMVEPSLRAALEQARDHVLAGKGPYVPRGFEDAVAVPSPEGQRWYLPRASPLYGVGGSVTGATLIVQDVTRLRRFDELRDNMIATVAHEFRTPLTSLRMAIHLCVEGAAGELTPKQLDLLGAAREDCERLQGIVDDLLDFARLQARKVELELGPVRPDDLVEHALADHRDDASGRGITLATRITPSLDDVLVDRPRIQLVFANLISNALRHSSPGDRVTVSADPDQGFVRFAVEDEGSGVPEEDRARVFERFYRVPGDPAAGAGLGLSIAREIVAAHGGSIGVSSAARRGASFWFTIPVVGQPVAARRSSDNMR